jgi:hypothetical protein
VTEEPASLDERFRLIEERLAVLERAIADLAISQSEAMNVVASQLKGQDLPVALRELAGRRAASDVLSAARRSLEAIKPLVDRLL